MPYDFMNIDWSREELETILSWAATIGYRGTAQELKHAVELNLSIVGKLNDALAPAAPAAAPAVEEGGVDCS